MSSVIEIPNGWLADADRYRQAIRSAAASVLALPAVGHAVYVPKAQDELEHLLALWPNVVAVPIEEQLSIDDLIRARAWPVHPLFVATRPVWADGQWCSPAEMFFHDVDHARFKVREDLLARGHEIRDPYQDGSTFDAATGRHRTVLDVAASYVDDEAWQRGPDRDRQVRAWFESINSESHRDLALAARWLLFEMVHEKALPIDSAVLTTTLRSRHPVTKLRAKVDDGFFASFGPDKETVASLDAAADWLVDLINEIPA